MDPATRYTIHHKSGLDDNGQWRLLAVLPQKVSYILFCSFSSNSQIQVNPGILTHLRDLQGRWVLAVDQPLMASTLSVLVIQKAGCAITSGLQRLDLSINKLPRVWVTIKSWSKNQERPLMASTLSALVIQQAGCTITSGLQRPDLGTNKLPRVWATIKSWSKNQEQPLMASTPSALVIQKVGCAIIKSHHESSKVAKVINTCQKSSKVIQSHEMSCKVMKSHEKS